MKRGWWIGGGAALLAAAAGLTWLLQPAPEPPAPRELPSAEEVAAKAEAKRSLEQAIAAAFPEGTLATGGETARIYDDHQLIEAPFGPVLLSRGHALDASHADAGAIAVHYLAPAPEGYRLVRAWPEAALAGSFGDLSEWAVSDKFSDLPVVYAEGGGTWQGYTCTTTKLVELTPRGPVELAAIQTGYDDSGAKEQGSQTFDGTIADIVKGKGFTVRFTGTRSFAERYLRKGDRFVLQSGKSQVTEC